MMSDAKSEKQLEAVRGWWNSDTIKKWDKKYHKYDAHTMMYLNSRQAAVLKLVDELKLKRNAKVLELGYGAGQTALKLGQRGLEVHGIDISEKLCVIAKSRCQEAFPDGKFYFKVGSIESNLDYSDENFDLVVIVGVLHYVNDHEKALSEIYRILKPGGYFVVAQANSYRLSQFSSFRYFMRLCVHFIFREKYILFPSFKSILVDSKLGFIFKRFEDTKIVNSKFMVKGHGVLKYELRKKLLSYGRLKSLIKRSGFVHLKANGAYYNVSENFESMELNMKADALLQKLAAIPFAHFIFRLARTVIILSQKKNKQPQSHKGLHAL